jgi:hypothetical protein
MRLALILLAAAGFGTATVHAGTCENGLPPVNPDGIYVDHGDGTVTDARTRLMWKRCVEGPAWNGTTCTGGATFGDWPTALALAAASTEAGHADWRLPSIRELRSLVETCRDDPSINDAIFPATPFAMSENFAFWSSSPEFAAPAADQAWFVRTGRGDSASGPRSLARLVRLVRDAP